MAAVSQIEQRAYIKIEYFRGITGKNKENLREACGGSAVLFNTVFRWLKRFRREDLTLLMTNAVEDLSR